MSTSQEKAGAPRGRSAVEQQVTVLRAQIGDDLKALRGSWERGWSWPRDVSRSPAAQMGGLMRAIPAWAAGILAGLLASVLMVRRGSTSGGRGASSNQEAESGRP